MHGKVNSVDSDQTLHYERRQSVYIFSEMRLKAACAAAQTAQSHSSTRLISCDP